MKAALENLIAAITDGGDVAAALVEVVKAILDIVLGVVAEDAE